MRAALYGFPVGLAGRLFSSREVRSSKSQEIADIPLHGAQDSRFFNGYSW
jgi:hypothetical protein